jgi:hypothetical protein
MASRKLPAAALDVVGALATCVVWDPFDAIFADGAEDVDPVAEGTVDGGLDRCASVDAGTMSAVVKRIAVGMYFRRPFDLLDMHRRVCHRHAARVARLTCVANNPLIGLS